MAFSNQADSITFPSGAGNGEIRMVVGADTPAELQLYGIKVALLFYVTDFESGLESGYFFIALSNILDIGNDEACLFGSVTYPVYGNPSSAGQSDVKTHFQMSWDFTGASSTGNAYTVFKDRIVQFNGSVPQIIDDAVSTFFKKAVFLEATATLTAKSGAQVIGNAGSILDWLGSAHFGGSFNVDLNAFFGAGLDVQGNLTNFAFASCSASDFDATSLTLLSNTAPAFGSPVCGTAFTAPPSGKVWVTVGGHAANSNNTFTTSIGWAMFTGGTVGSGTVVKGGDIDYSLTTPKAVTTGAPTELRASRRRLWGGLTPGAVYNVATVHWVSGGSGTVDYREISVEPSW